ncbi:MAG TPA: hypothetical protein VN241_00520, partial [Microbacterium sp.]|nr:hypothetical protein [Microbacterium sp.]
GEEITYSFLITNTGNVTLNDVVVTEGDFTGTGELSDVVCPPAAGTLAPDASVTCTATYTVTQADVDAGSISNSATATGTPPNPLTPPPVSPEDEVVIEIPPAPGITVEKSATPETIAAAGEEITYSFLVTNTGNVTLNDVVVTEGDFTGTGELSDVVCPPAAGTLAPDASVTCTATYTVTQADVDAGSITNSATATGTPPNPLTPPPVSPEDEVVIEIPPAPGITVVKTADEAAQDDIAVGQVITYSFLVTNTGNVTLADVAVDEGEFSGAGELSDVECPAEAASLAPAAQVTCTATYTVVQADVDAGTITNSATATGTPPNPLTPPPVSPESETTVPAIPAPGLDVVKTASVERATTVGQTIVYAFQVTNTGNVTLSDVTVNEGDFTGTGTLTDVVCPEQAASMAPGNQVVCTASYTVTQADLDAGSITNTATASGTTPGGEAFTSGASTVEVETPGTPLAVTGGANVLPWAGGALVLLMLGGALALRRRQVTAGQ